METLTVETKALNDKMQIMMEQLVLANNNRFGRKTKKCLIQTRKEDSWQTCHGYGRTSC